jgi:hypothetical protein
MKVPNSTEIYLNFGRRFLIPVNPEEITITHPSNNKTYEVLGVGEVVVPMSPGLSEASWEGFFPSSGEDPYTTLEMSPQDIVERLLRAKKNKTVGRLVISRSYLFDTNMRCIIEAFDLKDKGGEPGDIYYSITLKEYRDYSPEVVSFTLAETDTHTITSTVTEQTPQAVVTTTQTAQTVAKTQTVAAKKPRPVEKPVLRVGATVIANGKARYTPNNARPSKTMNNVRTTVTRILSGTGRYETYPIYLEGWGYVQESQLEIVG